MKPPMYCVFCTIAADADNRLVDLDTASRADVVRSWPDAVALVPMDPVVTGGHLLVLPRTHVNDAAEDAAVTTATMARAVMLLNDLDWAANIITSRGIETIPHLHVHIIRREEDDTVSLPWDVRS